MFPENNKNKKLNINNLEYYERLDNCKVSKASTELMLERFSDGEDIEFPFS